MDYLLSFHPFFRQRFVSVFVSGFRQRLRQRFSSAGHQQSEQFESFSRAPQAMASSQASQGLKEIPSMFSATMAAQQGPQPLSAMLPWGLEGLG